MLIPIMSAVQRIEVGLVINGLRVILFSQSRHQSFDVIFCRTSPVFLIFIQGRFGSTPIG